MEETKKPDTTHFTKSRVHPLVAQMPAHLKDPANYKKIRKALLEAGATTHSHGEVLEWASCIKCQKAQNNRLLMMKAMGFTSKAMYMTWRKINEEIIRKNLQFGL